MTFTSPRTSTKTLTATGALRHKPVEASRPDMFEMVGAVALQTGCSDEAAANFIEMIQSKVDATVPGKRGVYELSEEDLAHHALFKRVFPPETRAKAGSAGAIIERGLQARITHTRTPDQCAIVCEVIRT